MEYYFSKDNLARDSYLVSLMNSQLFVPLEDILKFQHIATLAKDIETIANAIEHSDIVVLSPDRKMVKPNMSPPQRTTIIVRNLQAEVPEQVSSHFSLPLNFPLYLYRMFVLYLISKQFLTVKFFPPLPISEVPGVSFSIQNRLHLKLWTLPIQRLIMVPMSL